MAEYKTAAHTFLKDGIFYFCRSVPKDLQHHDTWPKIAYSLRTRSLALAASRAQRAAQTLDANWYHLRVQDTDLPGKHRIRMAQNTNAVPLHAASAIAVGKTVKLSERSVSILAKAQSI